MMKRSFTRLMAAFALFVFMVPALTALGQTRADEVYSTCLFGSDYNSQSIGSYTATWTASNGDFTWTIVNGNNNNNGWAYVKFGRKNYVSVGQITTAAAYSEAITKVELTIDALTASKINSIKLYSGTSANSITTLEGEFQKAVGTQTVAISNPAADKYYDIKFDCASGSTNGLIQVSKVEYYYSVGGNPVVVTPTIYPNGGAFLDSQEVSIACATEDATIYYTTNGNDPTTSSSVYSAPFTINATTTVKALAVKTGMDNSEVASAEFVKVTPMSVDDAIAAITAAGANIPIANQCVTGIVCTASNNIYSGKLSYYISDDGTTTNRLEAYNGLGLYGEAFTSVDDVQVGDVVVIYGDLTKYNSTYEFAAGNYLLSLVRPAVAVEAPTFDPDGGTFTAVQSVTISCETPDVTIYYTTDGTDPTNESTLYEGPVTVGESMTLKARAYDNNNNASAIASATFTINLPYSGAPYARINNVSYLTDGAKVIFAARFDENADKYYAMTAATSGKPTGVVFTSTTSNDFEVLPAAIVDAENTYCWTVGVTADGYTFTNANNQVIGWSSSTNFATGGDNTEWTVELGTTGSSAMVPSYEAFNINNKNTPARAFALNSNNNFGPYDINSNNNSGSYNFSIDIFVQGAEPTPTITIAAPTFTKADGTPVTTATFASGFRVIATCETEGASVYYTTDGSTPDINSTLYQPSMSNGQDMGGISARYTTTIKAVGYLNGTYSPVSTVTLFVNTADSPYTVTQALAFYEYPTSQIWVRGIVCTAPTQAPTANGQLTYYISVDGEAENRLEVYKGLGLNQAAFTAQDDIKVGDIVTVYGIVSVYNNTTIEFTQGNYLTYFERPVNLNPTITVTPATVEVNADEHDGTLALSYENLEISDMSDFAIQYYDAEGEEAETPDWIEVSVAEQDPEIGEGYVVSYYMLENEGEARTAYFKVWALGDEDYVYSNLVTINQAEYVIDYAELPFEFDGGRADIANTTGLTHDGLGGDYGTSPKLKFDGTGDWLLLHFNGVPGVLSFDIKGNTFSDGTFTVQTSEDGETYTDLATFTELGNTEHMTYNTLGENVRYIKWVYTNKVNGNVALGNIGLTEYVAPQTYTLAIGNPEHATITATYDGDEILTNDDEADVLSGTEITLFLTLEEGYVLDELTVVDADQQNVQLTPVASVENTWTFTMPFSNVTINATAVEAPVVTTSTYTLATSIESGKTYIIVGWADGNPYAMGEQRSNNRAGVGITVDGTTATVSSEGGVYEFVVASLGEGFYSIYDDVTPGYLYAAGSGKNYLRTETELDADHNGEWEITLNSETGLATVVATNSNNRNVMQFNHGDKLFSCYASDSQHPVYFYVKNEEPVITTVTQTTELVEGWNWFSTYITIEDPVDLLDMLKESLGENALQIQASNGAVTEFDGEEWFGDLDDEGIFNEQGYWIETSAACTVELTGVPAVVDEYEITINPGWNWIGFPSAEPIDVADALANFDAEETDQIQCNDATSTEFDGEEWFGDLETFTPGQGYKYYSASDETKILVFTTAAKKKLNNANPTRK